MRVSGCNFFSRAEIPDLKIANILKKIVRDYIREKESANTWARFTDEINALSAKIDYQPDIIVGIARGGVIPAVMLAKRLNVKDMYCLKVRKDEPRTVVAEVFTDVNQKKILLVEDILDTGKSLESAIKFLMSKGAEV